MNERRRPVLLHGFVSFGLALALAGGSWYALGLPGTWPVLAAAWFVALSLVTFAYYGWDKRRAQRNDRRIPEAVLLGLALAGGSLGAFAGMRLFRHKTIKGSFRVLFWLIVILQVTLAIWLAYRAWAPASVVA